MAKNQKTNPLAARKELLVAESDLNRLHLLREIRAVRQDLDDLKQQVVAVGSAAASIAKVAVTVSAIRRLFFRGDGARDGKKTSSWMSTVLAGVQTGASLWGMIRPRSKP